MVLSSFGMGLLDASFSTMPDEGGRAQRIEFCSVPVQSRGFPCALIWYDHVV